MEAQELAEARARRQWLENCWIRCTLGLTLAFGLGIPVPFYPLGLMAMAHMVEVEFPHHAFRAFVLWP